MIGLLSADIYSGRIIGSRLLLQIVFIIFLQNFLINAVKAQTIEEQRKLYFQARNALQKGKITTFKNLTAQLVDYPLYPYLRYNYLYPRIGKVTDSELKEFIDNYADFPATKNLHTRWLKHLARHKKWQTYYENYTTQSDKELQCYQLQARININQDIYLLEDIRYIWLDGESLPPECDPAFRLLYNSELMTSELVWERISLAMENGKTGLAGYLAAKLDNFYAKWAQTWLKVHSDPYYWTKQARLENTPLALEILVYGIQRLARINLNRAITNWETLQTSYEFTPRQISETNRVLAIRAAKKRHPMAARLLDNIHNSYINDDVFHWRLLTALDNNDWLSLRRWTEGVAPYEDIKLRWHYWHARALEQTGDIEKAKRIFTSIASQRDYYGFLAADRLGQAYKFNHNPLPNIPEEISRVSNMPGIVRARELLEIKEEYQARREWQHALNLMTGYQKEMAALVARDWGWLDRVIITMGSAHSYDDLELRFPIRYEDIIEKYLAKYQLDPGWVYALIRSESAFNETAKSPAGALGLMQVMPQTGKEVARSIGWKKYNKNDLLTARNNVSIGSAYLKQMLKKFNENKVLATAAYNAGPHRVIKWMPKSECIEPDIWIEKIPFNETRKYVRRVLFYASIYDWRLQREITPMQYRMAAIVPAKQQHLAGLTCPGQQVTYNYPDED